jgi:hypothetical protein
LNQAIQQDPIEAAIAEPDTILVMLVEVFIGLLQVFATPEDKPMTPLRAAGITSAPRACTQGAGQRSAARSAAKQTLAN